LRRLARSTADPGQVRRLLALAAIYAGEPRTAAAIGGVGLQTVRDWVLRFNAVGPEGLRTGKAPGNRPILDERQRAAPRQIVEAGPARRCMASCIGASPIWCSGFWRSSASRSPRRR
jgi:transposase